MNKLSIYISHSTDFDYINELYTPLKKYFKNYNINFIFPHENSTKQFNSKLKFSNHEIDLIIAEVSYKSFGIGIELGWANIYNIPIITFHKTTVNKSNSLSVVSNLDIEYKDTFDMLIKINNEILKY